MARREEALAAAETLGDRDAIVATANRLAVRLFGRGKAGRALQLAERSLALCRDRSEMQQEAADAIMLMGELACSEGDLARGRELHEQALAIFQNLNMPKAAAWAALDLGDQAFIKGELVRARALHEESTAMWRGLDDGAVLSVELSNLGFVLIPCGELDRSRALLIESLSMLFELKSNFVEWPLMSLGILAHAQGQPLRAVHLLGAADAVRRPTGRGIAACGRREYDRALSSLRAQLGEEAFAAAWREGQALSLQEVVALAMSE
jgi:tetratricopeptide (TPR) repeat protein